MELHMSCIKIDGRLFSCEWRREGREDRFFIARTRKNTKLEHTT